MADNQFKISLGVSVDTSSISESIKKYNNRKNKSKIKVGVSLDSVGISKQIKAIAPKTPMTIKVRLDDTQALNQIKNIRTQLQQLNNIRINAGSVGGGVGVSSAKSGISSTVNEANKAYNDLMNLAKRINSIRFKIGGLDATKNSGQISELSNQLNRLMADYNSLYNTFTKGLNMSQLDAFKNKINSVESELNQLKATEEMFSKQGIDVTQTRANIEALENQLRELRAAYASFSNGLTVGQIDSLTNVFQNTTNAVAALNAKISDTRANFAKGIAGNIGGYDNQIISLENRLAALAKKPVEVRTGLESVKAALGALKNANGVDDIIAKYETFKDVLRQVEAQLKAQELREKKAYTEQSFKAAKDSALKKLNSLFTEGSAAAKKYSGEVERLRNELNNCNNIQGIRNVNKQITALQAEIKNTRIQTQSFGERIKTQFAKYSSYFSVASVFMYSMQGLRSMFNQVVAIDSAMTELKKVTDETNESYNKFLKNAASRAKEIGTTIDGLVSSTADFARLGYSFEDSQGLAEVANIYTVVGDEIDDVETATKSLISTLAAFKNEAGDLSNTEFAMEIIDKFNEVSNNFAISSGGIGDALQRSASSMQAANNTLDETIALITAANTVVQNPTKVGNAFKTVSMRIRGAKTELEEAGESTEGMAESTASLRKEILALSGVDIMLNENTFKSTYQILDELSTKWGSLSDIAQASITELIAGKHQGNVIASTMSNFDIAREALETSLNSSGSAMMEHEKWQQSLEARINKLKAAWQSLAQSFMSSSFLKGTLNAVIALVDGLTKLIDTVGTLPALFGIFAGGKTLFGTNGKGLFGGFFKLTKDEVTGATTGITNKFAEMKKSAKDTAASVNKSFGDIKNIDIYKTGSVKGIVNQNDIAAIRNYSNAISRGVSQTTAWNNCMNNASATAKAYVQNTNAAKVSVTDFANYLRTSYKKTFELSNFAKDNKSLTASSSLIKEYYSGFKNADKICKQTGMSQEDLLKGIEKGNSALANSIKSSKSASGAMLRYGASMAAAKASAFGLEVAVTAANMAMSMLIGMGVSFVISKVFTWIDDHIESMSELSERLDEVTSKYKEQHSELKKIKKDYDTKDGSSMVSRYEELSKGVDGLNRNLSLTTDEYNEYIGIVNKIADQVPSVVSGFDAQGNAILSCQGNVQSLTAAYESLIQKQNESIIKEAKNYEKDFGNKWGERNLASGFGHDLIFRDIEELEKVISDGQASYDEIKNLSYYTNRIVKTLGDYGLETEKGTVYDTEDIQKIINDFWSDFDVEATGQKTVAQAILSNAFDISTSGYYNMNDGLKSMAYNIVNGFNSEFFAALKKDGVEVVDYVNTLLDNLNNVKLSDANEIEAALSLKAEFNGGDISYGEYVSKLKEAGALIDRIAGLDDEIKSQIKISLGLNEGENGEWIVEQYETLLSRLTSEGYEIQIDDKLARTVIDNLNSTEISVLSNKLKSGDIGLTEDLHRLNDAIIAADEASVDLSKSPIFGNINAGSRQILEWNVENLEKYKDSLMSWAEDGETWDDISKELQGTYSTISGSVGEFGEHRIPIAFSTILETEDGAKQLSKDTVYKYIDQLVEGATDEKGFVDFNKLIALDAEGMEVDGNIIRNIVADIGDSAARTSEKMHHFSAVYDSAFDVVYQIKKDAAIKDALDFNANIEIDKSSIEAFNTALSESSSAMGLTSGSIQTLKSRYSDLDDYDASTLFEKTANGVKVNREELDKLEKQQTDLKKSKVEKHLKTLIDEYNELTSQIDNCNDVSERATLISERNNYKSRIEELAQYQSQLEGVTGAYQRWLDAQNTPEDYEGYQAVAASYENIEDDLDRGILSNASKKYIDLLSGKDLLGATFDEYYEEYKKFDDKIGKSKKYSILDFFTVDDDGKITRTGIDRFFESVESEFGDKIYKDGKYDFSSENLKAIQEEFGMSIDAISLILEAASSAGYEIDWGGILDNLDLDKTNLETLVENAEIAEKKFNELNIDGIGSVDFDFKTQNIEDATSELEKAKAIYNELIKDSDGDGNLNLDAEGAKEMRDILAVLTHQKQELERPAIMDVKVSSDDAQTNIGQAIQAVQDLQSNLWAIEEAAYNPEINTNDVQSKISEIIDKLKQLEQSDPDIYAKLGLDSSQIETLKSAIENIQVSIKAGIEPSKEDLNIVQSTIQGIDANAAIKYLSMGQEPPEDKIADVNYELGTQEPPENKTAKVNYVRGSQEAPLQMTTSANMVNKANGTAFARGNWSIDGNGVALGGELGQELVVRDGRFFTIGDNGAEFFKYKKNDIIFNASQTESLLKYGGIKGANPRGKVFASGTAFAGGSNSHAGGYAFASGSWVSNAINKVIDNAINRYYRNNIDTTNNSNSANGILAERARSNAALKAEAELEASVKAAESKFAEEQKKKTGGKTGGSGGGGGSSDAANEFEEVIDWIEVKIDRIERAIDQLDQKANSVYKSWTERNTALVDQIGKVREEIDIQQQAYDRYIQQANSVGLDEAYASKVRDGTIDIETITDEELKKKIDDYKQWYEKALDCKDNVEELKETEAELYAQRVEHAASQYEGILGVIEHEKSMLEEYINQSEAQAWIVSKEYYDALANNERENIAELQNQKAAMLAEFNAAMNSGAIAEGSEAYYEMVSSIDEVTIGITESQTALLEYEQTIQQLSWETFDMLQEKISSVVEETEFLIDLMGNDKLHDDTGKLTDEGRATMGLHGVAYNTYMAQADQAAVEAARLKKELEADPFDTELEERYREMVALQQEYILSAEDEKDAIRDLVEEGINLEIEALEERIDKYNEALESQKDLYDYQKKVAESTKEIASLEKQMAAYAGDDSEEARQKIQQIKVDLESARADLEETEYDKYISDTEKMLDDLSLKYEELLNMRLDNIDALIADMIQEINSDAGSIGETIREATDSVGYTLSESMNTIWDKSTVDTKNVITTYGEKFSTAQTTTNNALNTINNNLQNIINKLNGKAQTSVSTATTSSVANSSSSASAAANTSANNASGGNGTPKIGDKVKFVSGQYYYDSEGKNPIGSKNQGKEVYITNINNRANATHPYHISTGKKLGDGDLGWLKLNQISGYATGKKNFFDDEIAWTQENGTEFIVRPSDGAILTPIARGDKVLNAKASGNIWQMANSPAEFIRDNLNLGVSDVPNGSNVQNSYTQYLDKVVFNLPEVKNYEELLYAFQKDKNFERLIHAMTIDRVAGKSSLAKGKSIR